MPQDQVLIVGGGISGLATAYYLDRAGLRCTIIEKTNRLGGLIQTDKIDGCELEAGPDSFISTKTAVAELAAEIGGGLSEKIISSNDAARQIFVVRDGKLAALPKGMSMMVPAEWGPVMRSSLLGWRTKMELVRETFLRPLQRAGDFSVGDLVGRHFGPEMLEYVTEPLLAGVYGGDSASLSARSVLPRFVAFEEEHGSLIKGVRHSARQTPQKGSLFRSFAGGMQTLTDAIAHAIRGRVQVIHDEVSAVERLDQGWRVRLRNESIPSRQVVLACPAWAGAKMLRESASAVSAELAAIPYSSAVLAMLVFDKAELGHALNGFGFLVPRKEQETMAAATWVNTKFPQRLPAQRAALRAFIVGPRAEELAQAPREQVVEAVRHDFERLMGIRAVPLFDTVHAWPQSMPQFVVGHAERVERLRAALEQTDRLALTGNYFEGVGIPDCIRRAQNVAQQIGNARI